MHVSYALIVGASLARYARHLITRLAGLAYPPFVLLVIVATGNHFLVDAAVGAAVAGVALLAARLLVTPDPHIEVMRGSFKVTSELPCRCVPLVGGREKGAT
jgi:hypothetical protein